MEGWSKPKARELELGHSAGLQAPFVSSEPGISSVLPVGPAKALRLAEGSSGPCKEQGHQAEGRPHARHAYTGCFTCLRSQKILTMAPRSTSSTPFYTEKPRLREQSNLSAVTQQASAELAWVLCIRSPSTVSQGPPSAPTFRISTLLCSNNGSLSVGGKPVLLERDCRK